MGCLGEVPGINRVKGYDYPGTTWRWLAVNRSGEMALRRGETLTTSRPVVADDRSGGVPLASGPIDRVIIKVPAWQCSGTVTWISGLLRGIWVGGKSGTATAPYTGSGCLGSGWGFFMEPGDQKELYVQQLQEVSVAGEPSGTLVMYMGEVITEP